MKLNKIRGMGLAVILVIFTFLELIVIGIFNYTNLSQLSTSSALLSKDQLAINLSHTNCNSSANRFVELANTPTKREFELVRNNQIVNLNQAIQTDHDSVGTTGIKLIESQVRAISQEFFGKDKRESYGILEFKSRAEFKKSGFRLIDQEVAVYREYRTVYTGFPRPLNSKLFFLEDADGFLDGNEFNGFIKKSLANIKTINDQLRQLKEYAQEVVTDIRQNQEFEHIKNILRLIDDLSIDFEAPKIFYYPDHFSLSSISDTKFDFLVLDQPTKIREISRIIERKDADTWNVFTELKSILTQLVFESTEDEVQAIYEELREHLETKFQPVQDFVKLEQDRLNQISAFQSEVIALAKNVEDAQPRSELFDLDAMRKKAFFILKSENIQLEWDRFRSSMPVLNGIIFIDNPSLKLELSGAIKGKLTIVCSGEISLKDFQSEREGRDHLNVIAHSKVQISGFNRLNLHVGTQLKSSSGATIEGVVYLSALNPYEKQNALVNLNKDNKSTDPTRLYYFALGPRTLSTIINGGKQ